MLLQSTNRRLKRGLLGVGVALSSLAFLPSLAHAQAVVNDCQTSQFTDRRAGVRTITWDFGVTSAPERCMQVQVGQTVVWNGDLSSHPLAGSGGDSPNPISAHQNGSVTFTAPGTFGFVCLAHSSMKGAIQVLAAPAAAAPALSFGQFALLLLLLTVGGLVGSRRSRPRSASSLSDVS